MGHGIPGCPECGGAGYVDMTPSGRKLEVAKPCATCRNSRSSSGSSSSGSSQSGCFAGDSLVHSITGQVRLKDVNLGDVVLGFAPGRGFAWSPVGSIRRVVRPVVTIAFRDAERPLEVTPDHVVHLADGSRQRASGLRVGQCVLARAGDGCRGIRVVAGVTPAGAARIDTYNLYLEGAPCYLVEGVVAASFAFMPTARFRLSQALLHARRATLISPWRTGLSKGLLEGL